MSPWRWLLRVVSHDVAEADEALVAGLLADVAALQRFLQAREIDLNRRLAVLAEQSPSVDPDAVNARATGRSSLAAGKANKRAKAAADAPQLKAQMDAGRLSGEHLDAFAAAVAGLPADLRPRLLAMQSDLAAEAVARGLTVEGFRHRLQAVVRCIEADDGRDRLIRQRRAVGLRVWTDNDTGMGRISGQFDPETFMVLQQRIADQLEARFRQDRPAECPDDPLLAQDWLRAHALIDLVCRLGSGVGRPEVIVVIDEQTYESGRHARSRIDCGPGIEVPIEVIRQIGGRARFVPVVIDSNGVVIVQGPPVASFDQLCAGLRDPVSLDLGRSRRRADRHQRRALRVMYRSCAMARCGRHVSITEPHHVDHWHRGGRTDLGRLLPLCRHHHDRLHAERWDLELGSDRSLIVRRGGVVVMSTGPPAEQWR
ncbi:MAG: HNH endonuclease signature motif containing protein [Ilumatobacteraceae bacterium]